MKIVFNSDYLVHRDGYYIYGSANADLDNVEIDHCFHRMLEKEAVQKTHFFSGRYENIYADINEIPQVKTVLEIAKDAAATIFSIEKKYLDVGFWFNYMLPGQMTLAHTHDDYHEILSGVYYVTVPDDSGNLLLGKNKEITVIPEAGKFVFFSPDEVHEVTENKSQYPRLSIGMNVCVTNDALLDKIQW